MLAKAKPICFVATTSAAAAKKFYQKTLGLKLVEDTKFAIVFDSGKSMLRVQKVPVLEPASHTVMGWEVKDLKATVKGLTKKGVEFERYHFMKQDELGIWSTPDGSGVAWFKDPDGNLLSLTQF